MLSLAMPRHFELHKEAETLTPIVRAVVAAVLREPHGHPDVEDCANEALRRALEGSARLRDGEPLRPWVIGIARHVALDALRARKRHRLRHDDGESREAGDDVGLVERVPCPEPNPQERVAQGRRDAAIGRAIEALPAHYRDALVKFHLEGKGYQAIASEMNVPLGTVATWIARGRKAMAEQLGDEARER